MVLYVMRHAEAVAANNELQDEWRYLTDKGVKETMKVSRILAGYGRKPRLVISSPKVRAVQTAQIAATYAGRKCTLIVSAQLQADSDLGELQDFLRSRAEAKRVMLVGHEPHLGSLVAGLLRHEDTLLLKKSGCVALEFDPCQSDKPAKFLWYLTPTGKRITSLKKAFALK